MAINLTSLGPYRMEIYDTGDSYVVPIGVCYGFLVGDENLLP